ncbi:MAG: DUF4199 domain-containing protein [Acidobacteria bacterium]|nr:MAG: DUF4199 domain-containing protein [Acidobacteriota bacterium]
MKRIVLIFGLISGGISSAMMFLTLPLIERGVINFDNGELIGYTAIFLSFLLVFFGIRSYRESNGGAITFGRAFAVGLLITLISCVFYVASWEVIYFKFMPDFAEKFSNAAIASLRAKGASDAAIVAKKKQMAEMKAMYDNPLTNAAVTFLEPFPVGLVVTLISAGILRRRESVPGVVSASS